jgi:D-alanyl-D-alanine carboxypeptidase
MGFGTACRLAVLLGIALVPGGATARVSLAAPEVRAAIAAAVQHERRLYGTDTPVPGVLVGVWDRAGGAYVHGFGYADLATRRRLRPDDAFRIGSNTKTFVVSVLLQLVDEGRLRLDDPLSRFHLGVTIPDAAHITLRELCQMRSGLFEAYDTPQIDRLRLTPTMHFDPRRLVAWAVRQKPYFPPGAGYRYSNTNYLILGLVIEAVTGRPVAAEIGERLLRPFHLTATRYPTTQALPRPRAHGYQPARLGGWQDVSDTLPVSLLGAAGGMVSDMDDMRRWLHLWLGGRTNGAASQRARLDCLPTGAGNLAFGLGVGCSAGWYGYTGVVPGYSTADYENPAAGVTVFAWVTEQADEPPPGVANAIFRAIARIVTPDHVPFLLAPPTVHPAVAHVRVPEMTGG